MSGPTPSAGTAGSASDFFTSAPPASTGPADHSSHDANESPSPHRARPTRRFVVAGLLALAAVGTVGIVVSRHRGGADPRPSTSVAPADAMGALGVLDVDPTHGTPLPDIEGAVIADDGLPPARLGEISGLPESDRLDFLATFCDAGRCFRDAVFVGPELPDAWPGDRPFHVRHGFVNEGERPLDTSFDLAVYIFPMSEATSEMGGIASGPTRRYVSDYVIREDAGACGPTYREQSGATTCELFVHEFPQGLPPGRWGMWAVWEAPCSAWSDLDFIDECDDPDRVVSMFSSGVDTGFEQVLAEPTGRITHP